MSSRNFFDTLSIEEKQRIRDRTDALVELLENWVRRHPFMGIARIPMAALTTATVLPEVSPVDSVLTSQMILWIFEVDDTIDKRMIGLEGLQQKAGQWYSIANGSNDKIDESDGLSVILSEMTKRLSEFPLFESLRGYWTSCLCTIVEVMAQEYRYASEYAAYGPQALPSLEEYLQGGAHSVGFPLWGSTALILMKDFSILRRLELLDEVVKYTGAALRLYNDVATLGKDLQECDINSILIVYHAMISRHPTLGKERALSEAKKQVLWLADSYAQKCYDLAGQLGTDSGQFEETNSRLVAFHAYFYGYTEHDYHTTSRAETYGLLGGNCFESLNDGR